MKQPLVTCIMPTLPSRHELALAAERRHYDQTFQYMEWIVQSDSTRLIGSLRNGAIRRSTGCIVAHFDDDDWSAPTRLERCVAELKAGADMVGSSRIYYHEPSTGRAWLYDGAAVTFGPPWIAGGTLVYRRSLWDKLGGFDPWATQGEDTDFVTRARAFGAKVVDLKDPTLYVATKHESNTCKKQVDGPGWTQIDMKIVTDLMEQK